MPERQAKRSPSPARTTTAAEGSSSPRLIVPEHAPRQQPATAVVSLEMVSKEVARSEVIPIMGAYRAEIELLRCELADG